MIDVVLIEPETLGNTGAVARVMKNFGFKRLVLINPKCDHQEEDALKRAKHAGELLKKARVLNELPEYDYIIGTTSKQCSDYNIPRSPITPVQLGERMSRIRGKKTAILFGRESSGLSNTEIGKCDFVVTIPSDKKYPAINISHAAAIILYELSEGKGRTGIAMAGKKEKDELMKSVRLRLDSMQFPTLEKKETQKKLWKRIIGKSMLTKREAFALFGFFRRLR